MNFKNLQVTGKISGCVLHKDSTGIIIELNTPERQILFLTARQVSDPRLVVITPEFIAFNPMVILE